MSKRPVEEPLKWAKSPLLMSEHKLLRDWARRVRKMFRDTMPYHVGSSLTKSTYRDVDVRVMLIEKYYNEIEEHLDLEYLNLSISLWGQKVTGLPIDFQIQQIDRANSEFNEPRSAIGIEL